MARIAEFPDQHVVHLACQFLETAELLWDHAPAVNAPSALRANAAFAIELFIKSLDSHWEIDSSHAVRTQANTRGHNLEELFAKLPVDLRENIRASFCHNPPLDDLLATYARAFELERYSFEREQRPYESRFVAEIMTLARFFRDYVTAIPTCRLEVA
jgi:hypothetical protein